MSSRHGRRLPLEYVVPIRWDATTSAREAPALRRYLSWLCTLVDVTIVDGSDDAVFCRHDELWGRTVRHLRPTGPRGPNGKVTGVVTGVTRSRHERVVVADDDVRYDADTLNTMFDCLGTADVVRPQCVFDDLRWHTRWDTGRILINRAWGHDFPGTHGLRRSAFMAAGGYDDRALFENLEMTRTLEAAGGTIRDAPWLYVRRIAPSTRQFWAQRVRQAYDDFAQPTRLAAELALLPALAIALGRRPGGLVLGAIASVALAERGRRKAGGDRVFERSAGLWAPLWVLERSICVWVAVVERSTGGARYRGQRLRLAAHSPRHLRSTPRPAMPRDGPR